MKVKVGGQAHPAMLDPADATGIEVPFVMIASGDEDAGDVEKFGQGLKGEKVVERWEGMQHGFMAARADLEDEKVREGYSEGYRVAGEFLGKFL